MITEPLRPPTGVVAYEFEPLIGVLPDCVSKLCPFAHAVEFYEFEFSRELPNCAASLSFVVGPQYVPRWGTYCLLHLNCE